MKEESSNDEINILNLSDIKDEIKEQPRISMFNPLEKLAQSLTRQRNRAQSLPLKAFKVSSPEESNILSIICDNIFEDEVINDNINLSMIKLKTKINIKNTFNNEEANVKKSNKKLIKSKTMKEPENNDKGEKEEDDDFPQVQRPHKKSFIFNNILKIRNIKCPRLLEDQWKYEKILLDYNIIDFTSKKI